MDPATLSTIAQVLQATGPYGLVVVLGWALWKYGDRKDRELKTLYERVLEMSAAQTNGISKMEAALVSLRDAIRGIKDT